MPQTPTYQCFRFGAITPSGWLRTHMQRDLEQGFVGHLDALVPDLILHDDIYGADRLTKAVSTKELGVVAKERQWEVQFLWWNSETQSNWLDGMVRTALLLEHPTFIAKARAHIERLLSTQDADGYLGIYAPDLRYRFTGENGELWAQASLFRVLLGWYEATGDERAFDAVRRAVDVTMAAYPLGRSHPFAVAHDFAGVGHGLMFTDVLDRLHQLTDEPHYLAYARWLYDEYSRQPLSQDDLQLSHLLDPDHRFQAHGVHTYEQIRSLLTAVYAANEPLLDFALAAALTKLETCLTPSGGPIGDEFIAGRRADADETGYEYCSLHELLDTYTHLLQKTGAMQWADRAEWLFFNAAQGARHPSHPAIAYLKTDNSTSMTGPLRPDDPQDPENPQIRYKYSPVHQDVAVCCAPNAGRIAPYYMKAAWLRSAAGVVAVLYGASELQTHINGVAVAIRQVTNYPFELELTFTVNVAEPVTFTLSLRKPAWAQGCHLNGVEPYQDDGDLLHVRRHWQGGEQFVLRFATEVMINPWGDDEAFVSYGPLLFALPLDGESRLGREYAPGFGDRYYQLATPLGEPGSLEPCALRLQRHPFCSEHPWDALTLHGSRELVPLGKTILRKVTFKRATGAAPVR